MDFPLPKEIPLPEPITNRNFIDRRSHHRGGRRHERGGRRPERGGRRHERGGRRHERGGQRHERGGRRPERGGGRHERGGGRPERGRRQSEREQMNYRPVQSTSNMNRHNFDMMPLPDFSRPPPNINTPNFPPHDAPPSLMDVFHAPPTFLPKVLSQPTSIHPNKVQEYENVPSTIYPTKVQVYENVPTSMHPSKVQEYEKVPTSIYPTNVQVYEKVPRNIHLSKVQEYEKVPSSIYPTNVQVYEKVATNIYPSKVQEYEKVPTSIYPTNVQVYENVPTNIHPTKVQELEKVPTSIYPTKVQEYEKVPTSIYPTKVKEHEKVPTSIHPTKVQEYEKVPTSIYPTNVQVYEKVPRNIHPSKVQEYEKVPTSMHHTNVQVYEKVPTNIHPSKVKEYEKVSTSSYPTNVQVYEKIPTNIHPTKFQELEKVPTSIYPTKVQEYEKVHTSIYPTKIKEHEKPTSIHPTKVQELEKVPTTICPTKVQEYEKVPDIGSPSCLEPISDDAYSPQNCTSAKVKLPTLSKEAAMKRLKSFSSLLKDKTFKETEDTVAEKKVSTKKKKAGKMSVIEQIRDEETRLKDILVLHNCNVKYIGTGLAHLQHLMDDPVALKNLEKKGHAIKSKLEQNEIRLEKEKEYKESKAHKSRSHKSERVRSSTERKKRKIIPKSWKQLKSLNISLSQTKTSEESDNNISPPKGDSRHNDDKRSNYSPLDDEIWVGLSMQKSLVSLRVNRFAGHSKKEYCGSMVRTTVTRPHITFSKNSGKVARHYMTRSEAKYRNKHCKGMWDIMKSIWEDNPIKEYRTTGNNNWYVEDWMSIDHDQTVNTDYLTVSGDSALTELSKKYDDSDYSCDEDNTHEPKIHAHYQLLDEIINSPVTSEKSAGYASSHAHTLTKEEELPEDTCGDSEIPQTSPGDVLSEDICMISREVSVSSPKRTPSPEMTTLPRDEYQPVKDSTVYKSDPPTAENKPLDTVNGKEISKMTLKEVKALLTSGSIRKSEKRRLKAVKQILRKEKRERRKLKKERKRMRREKKRQRRLEKKFASQNKRQHSDQESGTAVAEPMKLPEYDVKPDILYYPDEHPLIENNNPPNIEYAVENERYSPTAVENERYSPTAVENERYSPTAVENERYSPTAVENERYSPTAVENERYSPTAVENVRYSPTSSPFYFSNGSEPSPIDSFSCEFSSHIENSNLTTIVPVDDPVILEKITTPTNDAISQERVHVHLSDDVTQEKIPIPISDDLTEEKLPRILSDDLTDEKILISVDLTQEMTSKPITVDLTEETTSPPPADTSTFPMEIESSPDHKPSVDISTKNIDLNSIPSPPSKATVGTDIPFSIAAIPMPVPPPTISIPKPVPPVDLHYLHAITSNIRKEVIQHPIKEPNFNMKKEDAKPVVFRLNVNKTQAVKVTKPAVPDLFQDTDEPLNDAGKDGKPFKPLSKGLVKHVTSMEELITEDRKPIETAVNSKQELYSPSHETCDNESQQLEKSCKEDSSHGENKELFHDAETKQEQPHSRQSKHSESPSNDRKKRSSDSPTRRYRERSRSRSPHRRSRGSYSSRSRRSPPRRKRSRSPRRSGGRYRDERRSSKSSYDRHSRSPSPKKGYYRRQKDHDKNQSPAQSSTYVSKMPTAGSESIPNMEGKRIESVTNVGDAINSFNANISDMAMSDNSTYVEANYPPQSESPFYDSLSSPKRPSLTERLRNEHGVFLDDSPSTFDNNTLFDCMPPQAQQENWNTRQAESDGSARVIQVGNVLEILPQELPAFKESNKTPLEQKQKVNPAKSMHEKHSIVPLSPSFSPPPEGRISPLPPPSPVKPAEHVEPAVLVTAPVIPPITGPIPGLSSEALISAAAAAAAASNVPFAQLISVLQEQNLLPKSVPVPEKSKSPVKEPSPEPHPPKPDTGKVDIEALRRASMERRERKRKEKERRKRERKMEKEDEIARQIALQQAEEDDDEALYKEAISEVPDLDGPAPDSYLMDDEDEMIPLHKSLSLPPPDKGILVLPTYKDGFNQQQKTVCFADGIIPGDGTSASGEEDTNPPMAAKSVKRKQKKDRPTKKKTKTKEIKTFDCTSDGICSPPPPPDYPPPPDVIKLYPGWSHCTYTSPETVILYTQQLLDPMRDQAKETTVMIPPGMLIHSAGLMGTAGS